MNIAIGDAATPRGPGVLRTGAIALAALALTGLFMLLRFPYERVADRVAAYVAQESGTRITLGDVSVGLVRWAPGLSAEHVQVLRADGTRLDLDRVGVRPALSLSWLRGRPALATDVESAHGNLSGVAILKAPLSFSGRLSKLDISTLPQDRLGSPLKLAGLADADLDFVGTEQGPVGHLSFQAREGTISYPQLPMPLPFQQLTGEVDLGGESSSAEIRELVLESPLANGRATGTIGRASVFATAPLQLEIVLNVSGPIRGSLNAQGVAVGNSGEVRLNVVGTVGHPVVR